MGLHRPAHSAHEQIGGKVTVALLREEPIHEDFAGNRADFCFLKPRQSLPVGIPETSGAAGATGAADEELASECDQRRRSSANVATIARLALRREWRRYRG